MASLLVLVLGHVAKRKQEAKDEDCNKFYPIYAMVKEVSGDLNDVRMIQSSGGILLWTVS